MADRDKQRKQEKLEEEQYRRALEKTLDTPHGRLVVWRMLERAGIYRSTFCGEETHRAAMLEGRRGLGLEVLDDVLTYAPQLYPVMQAEQQQRDHQREDTDG